MSDLSEDDSSDSSNEFLVGPDKINLNCSFFSEKKTKIIEAPVENDSESDTEDDDFQNVSHSGNIELFTQVLKNLEYSQKFEASEDNVKQEDICSTVEKEKNKGQQLKRETESTTSSNEISALLLQGETSLGSAHERGVDDTPVKNEEDPDARVEYNIPKDGIQITLAGTELMFRKKKRGGPDLKAIIRKRLRANQVLIEKVGLLCWLAYGFHLNCQITEPQVMSNALTLVSANNYPKKRIDLKYLEKFTKWFKNLFTFQTVESNGNKQINKESLLKILKDKKISDYKELVMLYVAVLRALGLNCRLIVSLYPPHKILNDNPLLKPDTKSQQNKSKTKNNSNKEGSSQESNKKGDDKKTVPENSGEAEKNEKINAKKRAAEILRAKSQNNGKKSKNDVKKDIRTKGNEKKDESKPAEEEKKLSNLRQLRSRKVTANPEDNKAKEATDLSAKDDGTKSKYYIDDDIDSEEEFQPKPKRLMKKKTNVDEEVAAPSSKSKRSNRKLLSSDSDNDETNRTRKTQDIWAEVYLESEESWICVSVMDEKIHCVNEVYKKAKRPVLYVVAWNPDGFIKDVTRRYCPHWLTVTRKQRVDEKWWLETLSTWKEKDSAISRAEDQMLLDKELEQPLPKTIGECKGHPLYVIPRHLLKFEGLYPPDCVPLGHLSTGDAIYSRHCVHILCSRETWLKRAKVVKPSQEPYKIVKARPKYDKLSGMKIKDSALELFGEWQTTDYEPPEAKDGIVPRNEYGNVDLFKQCMLPKGTVHINLPGLNRVARKLNIDCASAVVGFNFGCMGAVPALEGYVVCAEYEDTLREAWEAEQVEAIKRANEKREKRVYGNWKKLIQGLLIRERLAAKYEFSEGIKPTTSTKRTKRGKADAKKAKVS